MSLDDIEQRWRREKPLYEKIGLEVVNHLKNELSRHEIYLN